MSKQQSPIANFPLEHIERIKDFLEEKNLEEGPYVFPFDEPAHVSLSFTLRFGTPEPKRFIAYDLNWDDTGETWIISAYQEIEH